MFDILTLPSGWKVYGQQNMMCKKCSGLCNPGMYMGFDGPYHAECMPPYPISQTTPDGQKLEVYQGDGVAPLTAPSDEVFALAADVDCRVLKLNYDIEKNETRHILEEALLQLEYLNEKQKRGTTETTITRIKAHLAK